MIPTRTTGKRLGQGVTSKLWIAVLDGETSLPVMDARVEVWGSDFDPIVKVVPQSGHVQFELPVEVGTDVLVRITHQWYTTAQMMMTTEMIDRVGARVSVYRTLVPHEPAPLPGKTPEPQPAPKPKTGEAAWVILPLAAGLGLWAFWDL